MSDPIREDGLYPMRLQRYLARAGMASRRGAERLITGGRVRVNGEVVDELGVRVDPVRDVVSVDGVVCEVPHAYAYLVLNKPRGYLTTMSDPMGRPCVSELVPTDRFPGLFPVGRLDQDTTGVLLFTTDGMMGQNLLHPSRHVDKHYVALVGGTPTEAQLARLRAGVMLDDGPASPAEAALLAPGDPLVATVAPDGIPAHASVVGLTIHEGRKHQVKRMLLAVGHKVWRLHRDRFGPLTAGGTPEGSWRTCSQDELAALLDAAGLAGAEAGTDGRGARHAAGGRDGRGGRA